MNDLLSIFIPTYNRAADIDNLLHSIIVENYRFLENIPIYISSNNCEDGNTLEKVQKWKEKYPYIYYFSNEKNIGIDANHDKIYEYCKRSKYTLAMADDDLLLPDALGEIINLCEREFLFAICNAVPYREWGVEYKQKVYQCEDRMFLKARDMLLAMMYQVIPDGMCPLLPFYGGNIVNVQYMIRHTTSVERRIFEGTYHQYIGSLWNELFKNEKLYAVITEDPLVAIGYDVKKKTWIDEFHSVFVSKVPSFYNKLYLDEKTRREIINLYQNTVLKKQES